MNRLARATERVGKRSRYEQSEPSFDGGLRERAELDFYSCIHLLDTLLNSGINELSHRSSNVTKTLNDA